MANRVKADRQSDDGELDEILYLFPEKKVLFPKAIVETSVTPYFSPTPYRDSDVD